MACENEILIHAEDGGQAENAARAAIAEVRRIEAKYSRYREDSVISLINRQAGLKPIRVDEETATLLDYAAVAHRESEGAFDITSGVLRRVWDFKTEAPRLPKAEAIAALLSCVGWPSADWQKPLLRLPRPGWELDFGGLGKEYAADRAIAVLMQNGIDHALVNLGGDVRALGGQASGRPWCIGIRHPRDPSRSIASVALFDGALATSGDYERYFEIDGRRYCHLLDPRSGWPVDHFQSASVMAPLAIVAGSLASIAMLRGEAALPLLQSAAGNYLLVDREGKLSGNLLR